MKDNSKLLNISYFISIIGMIFICIGITPICIEFINTNVLESTIINKTFLKENEVHNTYILSYTEIPTYNQRVVGYRLGCEGISLYMALKGLGYIDNYSIDSFMDTMPYASNPFYGYSGNPKIGHFGENEGKRTTIYPEPLSKWAGKFASTKNLTGASIDDLKNELLQGHIIILFVTHNWNKPSWKHYPWSIDNRGEIENNHCLCVVGFNSNGDFLVNDCNDGRKKGFQGEYWVKKELFEYTYNLRKYAISVY